MSCVQAEGAIVYAELDLKTPAEGGTPDAAAVRMINDQTTEYAEILPVKGNNISSAESN